MTAYDIEVTDTFNGDANYCWVRRYTLTAASTLGAVQKLSRLEGRAWRKAYDDGTTARYDTPDACVCAFIAEQTEVTA